MMILAKTLPLLIVLVALAYLVIRSIGHVWLEHRVKLLLLEKLGRKPELLRSLDELEELMEPSSSENGGRPKLDFSLMGLFLALIGTGCVVLYSTVGAGQWAVGVYWGGLVCVVLAFLLVLLGAMLRFLSRSPLRRRNGR